MGLGKDHLRRSCYIFNIHLGHMDVDRVGDGPATGVQSFLYSRRLQKDRRLQYCVRNRGIDKVLLYQELHLMLREREIRMNDRDENETLHLELCGKFDHRLPDGKLARLVR